jgi:sensor domain DACNV-containing protein
MDPLESHSYPRHLTEAVLAAIAASGMEIVESPLLSAPLLESVFSTIFQASLLRDEGREVFFRALLCPPGFLSEESGPPRGLHAVRFHEFRRFRVQELRRLANAAPYQRALLGICVDSQGLPAIWGIVHSGARWLRVMTGGREAAPPLPNALVVTAGGAGRLEVSIGDKPLARLEGGLLGGTNLDVFASRWLPDRFAGTRAEFLEQHLASRSPAMPHALPDEALISRLGQHILKQLIAVIRTARHGGTLLIVPREMKDQLCAPNALLKITYRFAESPARHRFRTLMLAILGQMADAARDRSAREPLGWLDYRASTDPAVDALDEGMFEVAHLIAGLTGVDGAVVMTDGFDLLGFGAEIVGDLPEVARVERAMDVEGSRTISESTEGVGTRHRSAYRLCAANPGVVAIVVSQDGGVRIACSHDGVVTYWHYLSAGLLS